MTAPGSQANDASPAYRSVVLDVDSTLSGVEGIEWLGHLRPPEVAAHISALTHQAMNGGMPLQAVYGQRLQMIKPTRAEIEALSRAYIAGLSPGAPEAIDEMRRAGVHVILVSGGIREAIVPLAAHLGIPDDDVHAVSLSFDAAGAYSGFDDRQPLATATGKREVLEHLSPARPILAIGDGATDIPMREVADRFLAFTGFAARAPVVAQAAGTVSSFEEIARLVV